MRPIFTLHAGEYLVGDHLERKNKDVRVWIPSKDSGIDLLVTDRNFRKLASLQVKFSKDYIASSNNAHQIPNVKSGGWWKFDRNKLANSEADYWVLVLYPFHSRNPDYLVVPPKQLLSRYDELTGGDATIQTYFWVSGDSCWETRNLTALDHERISNGTYRNRLRNFSKYLNNWAFLPDA